LKDLGKKKKEKKKKMEDKDKEPTQKDTASSKG